MNALTIKQSLNMSIPFIWIGTDDQQRLLRRVFNIAKNGGRQLSVWNKFNGLYEIVNYNGLIYTTGDKVYDYGNEGDVIRHIYKQFVINLKSLEEGYPEKDKIYVIQNPDTHDIQNYLSSMIGYAEFFENNYKRFEHGVAPYNVILLTSHDSDVNPFPSILTSHMIAAKLEHTSEDDVIKFINLFAYDKNILISDDLIFKFAKELSGKPEYFVRKIMEYAFSISSTEEINYSDFSESIKVLYS